MKNSTGLITIDFLFAMCLTGALFAVFFALTLAMTITEITQYITFASARNYLGSHVSPIEQQNLAQKKAESLLSNQNVFAPFFKEGGWFEIQQIEIGYFGAQGNPPASVTRTNTSPYAIDNLSSAAPYYGVRFHFKAHALSFKVPIFGSTDPDKAGFTARIGSYLGREPTQQECQNFMNKENRIEKGIMKIFGSIPNNTTSTFVQMNDNGC